jgi:1,4-dihydroxy-2-naphthoate octaprenyltransferase
MDQQIRVNNRMIDFMHATGCRTKGAQWRFLMHSLSIIMTITSILLIRSKESDALEKKKALWDRLKGRTGARISGSGSGCSASG